MRSLISLPDDAMTKDATELLEELEREINPIVEEEGCELVDLEWAFSEKRRTLRFFIDREGGINLDDCRRLSRKIERFLDLEDRIQGQYVLEVSSPGLARRLKKEKDFMRHLGSKVKIETREALEGRKRFKGVLGEYDGTNVSLQDSQGTTFRIPLDLIHKANLAPDIK